MDVLYARVNHGRWLVDCPACASAQLLDRLAQRSGAADVFVCVPPCDVTAKVKAPAPRLRANIDAVLAGRPDVNRNWDPGETVAMLRAENLEHGVSA